MSRLAWSLYYCLYLCGRNKCRKSPYQPKKLLKMKRVICLSILCLLSISSFGQEFIFCTTKGVKCLYANRDASGKLINTMTEEVGEKTITGTKQSIIFYYDFFDKKGKSRFNGEPLKLEGQMDGNGKIKVKMSPMLKAMKAPDYIVKGNVSSIPITAKPGDKFPDEDIEIDAGISATMHVKDVSVIGEENVTTAAGTFKCIVVKGAQDLMGEYNTYKTYICKGTGIIKQEIWDKNGKLVRVFPLEKITR